MAKVSIVQSDVAPDADRILAMVREALDLIGGVHAFVQPNDTVVIKANFFAPFPPPVTVDRRVVAAVVRLCREAGARQVVVAEGVSVGSKQDRGFSTEAIFDLLGMRAAVAAAGGELLSLEDAPRTSVDVLHASVLHRIDYPVLFLDANVLIDLPCLKTHAMTLVTLGIKNFQGILTDEQKYLGHRDDLDQHLVDILRVRAPDLTVIDGLIAMEGNGAGEAGTPVPYNVILAGANVVAVDAVATACMGIEDVLDVATTRLAQYAGLGTADLSQIEVRGRSVAEVQRTFVMPVGWFKPVGRYVTGVYPNIDTYIGSGCPMCWFFCGVYSHMLAQYTGERWTIIAGTDPKIPPNFQPDLEHTIVLGDCPLTASGPVRELRTRMLLKKQGVLAPGCPPFRPAKAKIEEHLTGLGLLTPEIKAERFQQVQQRFFDYYQASDPTWKPG